MAGGVLARPFHENTTSKRFSTTMLSPFKEYFPDADQLIIGRVEELANRHAVTMAEIALAWVIGKGVCSPIIGISTPSRIPSSIPGIVRLTQDDYCYLEDPSVRCLSLKAGAVHTLLYTQRPAKIVPNAMRR